MIPIFVRLWYALRYDELAVRRWARGFLLWAGTLAAMVVPQLDQAVTWDLRSWSIRMAVAGLAGAAGLINLGERNPPALVVGPLRTPNYDEDVNGNATAGAKLSADVEGRTLPGAR